MDSFRVSSFPDLSWWWRGAATVVQYSDCTTLVVPAGLPHLVSLQPKYDSDSDGTSSGDSGSPWTTAIIHASRVAAYATRGSLDAHYHTLRSSGRLETKRHLLN